MGSSAHSGAGSRRIGVAKSGDGSCITHFRSRRKRMSWRWGDRGVGEWEWGAAGSRADERMRSQSARHPVAASRICLQQPALPLSVPSALTSMIMSRATEASSSSPRSASTSQLLLLICDGETRSAKSSAVVSCVRQLAWPSEWPAPVRFSAAGPHCTPSRVVGWLRCAAVASASPRPPLCDLRLSVAPGDGHFPRAARRLS